MIINKELIAKNLDKMIDIQNGIPDGNKKGCYFQWKYVKSGD